MSEPRRRPNTRPSRGPSLRIDRPETGYYRTRLYSKGPWVPAQVYEVPARDPETFAAMDRAPTLACIVNGQARDLDRVWTSLHPISEAAYHRLVAEREGVEDVPINESAVRI